MATSTGKIYSLPFMFLYFLPLIKRRMAGKNAKNMKVISVNSPL